MSTRHHGILSNPILLGAPLVPLLSEAGFSAPMHTVHKTESARPLIEIPYMDPAS